MYQEKSRETAIHATVAKALPGVGRAWRNAGKGGQILNKHVRVGGVGHRYAEGSLAALRTFNAATGTGMARLRKKDRWLDQAQAMNRRRQPR
jgi:hypothetical protein